MLSKRINIVHVHRDMLLDDELSDPAQEAKALMANNQAVPDAIWVNLRRLCILFTFLSSFFFIKFSIFFI